MLIFSSVYRSTNIFYCLFENKFLITGNTLVNSRHRYFTEFIHIFVKINFVSTMGSSSDTELLYGIV